MVGYGFYDLKKIFFLLIIFFVVITVIILDTKAKSKAKKWPEVNSFSSIQPTSTTFLKVFHLDLKGGPPKFRYLISVLPIIRKAGANGILIEYEDMFPFAGKLKNISARNAYKLTELKMFIEFAESIQMEVIPLVQVFGHLEYVLKLEEFQHLRELDTFPEEICPSNKEAIDLIKEMIKQIMSIHTSARYIHIGCDEVRHLSSCSRCSRIPPRKNFARHVVKIADHVRRNYPGVTPLIWDDMFRRWTFKDLENSGLGSAVEPVVWAYASNIFDLVPLFVWNVYQRVFPKIWTASAFKGAVEETETFPDIEYYLKNNLFWSQILSKKEKEVNFKDDFFSGIFITGWSRYDHFAILCELLPVGIPSLILCLQSLQPDFEKDPSTWLRILQCPDTFQDLDPVYFKEIQYQLGNCSFPGNNLYESVARFEIIKLRAKKVIEKVDSSGWVSSYNFKKNFTSPWRLREMFPGEGFGAELLRKELVEWKYSSLPVFFYYFDNHTINEWVEQHVNPLEEKLLEVHNSFLKLIGRKIWSRRPLQ